MEKEPFKFDLYTQVVKVVGDYDFPGIVVSRFHTLQGKARYVVEATGVGYRGMLHIFSANQLERRP